MVECPECESDVNLDDDNECPNCGLDVAWVYEKRRRDKAVERLRQREEEETGKSKKEKNKPQFGF